MTAPWTEAHRREVRIRKYEIAAERERVSSGSASKPDKRAVKTGHARERSGVRLEAERPAAMSPAPARWTKGALARDTEGYGMVAEAVDAVCYCVQGAIEVNALECDDGVGIAFGYLRKALIPMCSDSIPVHVYNDADSTTHEDILALLDRAIVLAESALGGKP